MPEYTDEQIQSFQDEFDQKAIIIRDGSCLRTADELNECFIADACSYELLKSTMPDLPTAMPDQGEPTADDSQALYELTQEYEYKLFEAGYTVIWNDGYVIYKDLSEEASEYLSEVCF